MFKTEVKNAKCLDSLLTDGNSVDNSTDAAKDCWKINVRGQDGVI